MSLGVLFLTRGQFFGITLLGGRGLRGTAQRFEALRFRSPMLMATLVAMCEVTAGILFILGFVTPVAAYLVAVILMNGVVVHWPQGFWVHNNGFEYPLVLLAAPISLAMLGAGRLSIDHELGWDKSFHGTLCGLLVFIFAAATSGVIMTLGRLSANKPQAPPA